VTNLLSLTERIDRFQHRNLGVKFAAPWATLTGKWEVSEPNRAAVAYDNGFVMMDDLEKRYPRNLRRADFTLDRGDRRRYLRVRRVHRHLR
jgi:hypothetical protein